ncbi:hypothetical protein [Natrinema caseinilyticum]|uniref:hypothetical protein n=1 Tax=Natrinema caseinilyticum TaxID=2961570 RepID=UPI0020C2BFC0|nr:hypothetical protein [Natrinema caseinilyticum]
MAVWLTAPSQSSHSPKGSTSDDAESPVERTTDADSIPTVASGRRSVRNPRRNASAG